MGLKAPFTRIRIFLIRNVFFPDSKISMSTLNRIRCGFIIFHSGGQIQKYSDSPDAGGLKPYPERKTCGFKNIRNGIRGTEPNSLGRTKLSP